MEYKGFFFTDKNSAVSAEEKLNSELWVKLPGCFTDKLIEIRPLPDGTFYLPDLKSNLVDESLKTTVTTKIVSTDKIVPDT